MTGQGMGARPHYPIAPLAALLAAMAALLATACDKRAAATGGGISVVAATFPEYDWARSIIAPDDGRAAPGATLTLLAQSGVDMHSYQPGVKDIAALSAADVFIHTGGESDYWADGIIQASRNGTLLELRLLDVLGGGAKTEEHVEGMQQDDDDDEQEYDEHVWLSLRNARLFCLAIADALCALDAQNAALYRENAAAYCDKLDALDAEYTRTVDSARLRTILVADRFPFRYLADDYGLSYYAAFAGCSAETEASFATIAFLSHKLSQLQLPYVIQTESSDTKIARTVIQNSGLPQTGVLVLDSMQSVARRDQEQGASYLGIMRQNLGVLAQALN